MDTDDGSGDDNGFVDADDGFVDADNSSGDNVTRNVDADQVTSNNHLFAKDLVIRCEITVAHAFWPANKHMG